MIDPLFDKGAGVPDLSDFLASEYRMAMEARNEKYRNEKVAMQIPVATEMEKIQVFLNFVKDYLNNNRPTQLQHVESNFCITLTNNQNFLVSPAVTHLRGSMQQSISVPVTGRAYQEEIGGVAASPRTYPAQPEKYTDMTLPQAQQDRTANEGLKRFDQ